MSELTDKQKIDILNYSIEEAKEIIEDLRNQNAELREELDLKNKVIDKVTKEIEILRQYFDESSQPDFIRILEILRK